MLQQPQQAIDPQRCANRRLRIWVVSQSYLPYYGGITEHVWHLTAQLAGRGHEVRLITGRPLRAPHGGEDSDPPGVTITRLGRTLRHSTRDSSHRPYTNQSSGPGHTLCNERRISQ